MGLSHNTDLCVFCVRVCACVHPHSMGMYIRILPYCYTWCCYVSNPDEEEPWWRGTPLRNKRKPENTQKGILSSGCKPPQLHAKREQLSFPQKKGDGFTRQDTSTSSAAKSSAVTFTANPLAGHTFFNRSIAIIGCRQSILKAVLRGLCVSVNQYRPDSFSYMHWLFCVLLLDWTAVIYLFMYSLIYPFI